MRASSFLSLAQTIRVECARMINRRKSGHLGSMLSRADILSVLYISILRVDPKNPDWPDRNRFSLSKGRAGAAEEVYVHAFGTYDWLLGRYGFSPKSLIS